MEKQKEDEEQEGIGHTARHRWSHSKPVRPRAEDEAVNSTDWVQVGRVDNRAAASGGEAQWAVVDGCGRRGEGEERTEERRWADGGVDDDGSSEVEAQ